ncbi:MAG: hypothetical protein A3K59_08095 [Euryarchaeota archaeon RBG_19FT_COMBO_69_17]|nr:MAG: hypothetical protein A3K59_08095 [Euryarchaeota archaeon RBG_19FT_COMBO_69_17]
MAKAELSGTVISFRQSKHRQDSRQTIVHLARREPTEGLLGARVVWRRKDGLRILGRVVAGHGTKGALRVRWSRGFPPQALGSPVTILR